MTVTATPDEGYQLDTLTVTDSQGNRLKLTDQGGGKFTFIMPGSQVKVEASFVLIPRAGPAGAPALCRRGRNRLVLRRWWPMCMKRV